MRINDEWILRSFSLERASCCIFGKRLGMREEEQRHLKRLSDRHLFSAFGLQKFSWKTASLCITKSKCQGNPSEGASSSESLEAINHRLN